MTAYRTPDGPTFDAHIYSAMQETGIFKLTVAEVPETGSNPGRRFDERRGKEDDGREPDQVRHRIRRVYGRQLSITGVNGGYAYLAVFHHNNRLYEIEGRGVVA